MMENVREVRKEGKEGRKKEREGGEIEFIARCLATVELLPFPFPSNPPRFSSRRIPVPEFKAPHL